MDTDTKDATPSLPPELQASAALAFFEHVLAPPDSLLEAFTKLAVVGQEPSFDQIQEAVEEVRVIAPDDYEGCEDFELDSRTVKSSTRAIVEIVEPAFSVVSSEMEHVRQDFLGRSQTMLFWLEQLPEERLAGWEYFSEWAELATSMGCDAEFFGLVARTASLRTQGRWAECFNLGQCWDQKFARWQEALRVKPALALNWLDLLIEAPEKTLDWNQPRGSWKTAYKDPDQYAKDAFQKLLETNLVTFVRMGADEKPTNQNFKIVTDALERKGFKARASRLAWGRLMPKGAELESDGMALMLWRFRKMVSLLEDSEHWLEGPALPSSEFRTNGGDFAERLSEHINRQAEGDGVVLSNILQDIEQHRRSMGHREDVSNWGALLETLRSATRLEKSLSLPDQPHAPRPRM